MQITRNLFQSLHDHLSQKEISLLVGARQVGKTTLLKSLMQEFSQRGDAFVFFNLDIERDAQYFVSQETLLQKIRLEIGQSKGYVLIDEIQRKENAGLFLKGLYDQDLPYKFIVTGSGSLELKEKIHESLAGRKRMFELGPVSFLEFVNHQSQYRYQNRIQEFFALDPSQTELLLKTYLNYGGFPRVITAETEQEKRLILDEIFRTYIEKDIGYLLNIDRTDAFSLMIKLIASQIGQQSNYSSLANQTGLSLPTVKKYLWYAEKTFFIHPILPFFRNPQKELTKTPQFYFNDVGMRNFALNLVGQVGEPFNTGFLFQNFLHGILKEKAANRGWKLHYWRTKGKAEVDFVLDLGLTQIPIEIKYKSLSRPSISRSFRNFLGQYQVKQAVLVNLTLTETIHIDEARVQVVPFYRLLDDGFWDEME